MDIKMPTNEDEENELFLTSSLQLVTVLWAKLVRRVRNRIATQKQEK